MFLQNRLLRLSFAFSIILTLSQNSFAFDISTYYPKNLMKAVRKTQFEINFLNRNFDNKTALTKLNKMIDGNSTVSTGNKTIPIVRSTHIAHSLPVAPNANKFIKSLNHYSNTADANNHSISNSTASTVELPKNIANNNQNVIITQKLVQFTNTTTINRSMSFVQNIKLLYEMGYLPFYPKQVNGNQVTWQWNVMLVPKQLADLTPQSSSNIFYRGAVKAFLTQNNLHLKNDADLYQLLEQANKYHVKAEKPFTWILVDQKQPERLKVWQGGLWVAESNCNTGVDHLTPDGNFLIYARYKAFTMSGRWPLNDHYYYVPNVPYVNFFDGGDAIHGFYRRSYGYPQSAGCVELPISNAKDIYGLLYIGTVVTIVN